MIYPKLITVSAVARVSLALTISATLPGCGKKASRTAEPPTEPPAEVVEATPSAPATAKPVPVAKPAPAPQPVRRVPVSTKPPPAEIWKEFSGDRAFAEVKKQVDIGPRPSGSSELELARKHIVTTLEANGWEVERQEFTDQTPRGPMKFVNLIGRFSADGIRPVPQNTQRAIVCSHYDTKRFSTIRFVGASDGASSTGALLELSRVLALNPALAAKIELAFFDGEEAVVQFTETDGLYGSRYYAKALREGNRSGQFVFGILWDMIGDADLTITLSPDSPAELTQGVLKSAEATGTRQNFTYFDRQIYDDHVPLNTVAHIPTVDLIDFDYLWWHTADDTMARLHPSSLQKVALATLHYLDSRLK